SRPCPKRKDEPWKAQRLVAEKKAEVSKSRSQRRSQKSRTFRIEIRPRDCRRPTSRDSVTANALLTNFVPRRRTRAESKLHSRHSKRKVDRCRAGQSKTEQQL